MKKTAKVAALTTPSSSTTPMRRRTTKRPMEVGRCGRDLVGPGRSDRHLPFKVRWCELAGDTHVDEVVDAERLVDVDVRQSRTAVHESLVSDERQVHRSVHDLLVDVGPDRVALAGVGLRLRLVDQTVDGRVVELGVVAVAAVLLDRTAVDDRLEEAVGRREVRTPA